MTVALNDPLWLKQAQSQIWERASSDLGGLFRSLDLENAKQSRDVLLREVPQVTTVYGEQTAVVAADWYDELRYSEGVPGKFRARMAPVFPALFVQERIRYGAAHLFTSTPEKFFPFLFDAAQEYVLRPGRDTIQSNSIRDPQASGWQRVTSPDACKFCVMLAGRGGVYKRATASFAAHGSCNCSAVPSWDPTAPEVPVSAYVASARTSGMDEEQKRAHRDMTRSYLDQM